jgi:hemoglobin
MNPFQSIYELVGEEKIRQLTQHFYQEVAKNPKLRSLYPEDLAPAENRLFLFLLQVFGGPPTYSEQRGHPRLKMRHLDWDIDESMRDHWLNSMFAAIGMLDLDPNERELMTGYFIKVANHMINHA